MPDSTTQQIQMDHMTEGWRQNQRESFTWSGGKQKGRHMPARSGCISPTSCNTSLSAQSLTPWLDIRDKNNNAQSHMSSNLCSAQKAGFIHNLIGGHHFCPYWKALHLFEFKFLHFHSKIGTRWYEKLTTADIIDDNISKIFFKL